MSLRRYRRGLCMGGQEDRHTPMVVADGPGNTPESVRRS